MHVVEVQTVHADGSETWQRWRCRDQMDADLEAMTVRAAFMDVPDNQWTPGYSVLLAAPEWQENDLGEPVCVRAREYGATSQVRLGVFTIFT